MQNKYKCEQKKEFRYRALPHVNKKGPTSSLKRRHRLMSTARFSIGQDAMAAGEGPMVFKPNTEEGTASLFVCLPSVMDIYDLQNLLTD